jgi:hypothetical protein
VKLPPSIRAAFADAGRKGGKAKGAAKRRPKAHYKRLADMKRQKSLKGNKHGDQKG